MLILGIWILARRTRVDDLHWNGLVSLRWKGRVLGHGARDAAGRLNRIVRRVFPSGAFSVACHASTSRRLLMECGLGGGIVLLVVAPDAESCQSENSKKGHSTYSSADNGTNGCFFRRRSRRCRRGRRGSGMGAGWRGRCLRSNCCCISVSVLIYKSSWLGNDLLAGAVGLST